MKWIDLFLHKLGITDKNGEDDLINASTQDAAKACELVVDQLHEATQKRVQGNDALRRSLIIAKMRTNSFADFELQIQKEINRNVRRSD